MTGLPAYTCDACQKFLAQDWADGMFAIDAQGRKQRCLHPGEDTDAARHLGISYADYHDGFLGERVLPESATEAERHRVRALRALIDERVGFYVWLTCWDCSTPCELDLKREARQCTSCGGSNLLAAHEAVGKTCPHCKAGTIRRVNSGIRF